MISHFIQDVTCISKEREHFIVRGIIRDEETQVGIVQHCGDPDQTSPPSRDDGHILPCVLTRFALTMMCIVEIGNGYAQRLDPCRRAIFSATEGNINLLGAIEAPFNLIIHFGSPLTEVGPFGGIFGKAIFYRPLRTPHHTGGGSGGI